LQSDVFPKIDFCLEVLLKFRLWLPMRIIENYAEASIVLAMHFTFYVTCRISENIVMISCAVGLHLLNKPLAQWLLTFPTPRIPEDIILGNPVCAIRL